MSFQNEICLGETFIPAQGGGINQGVYVLFKGSEDCISELGGYPGRTCEEKIVSAFLEKGTGIFRLLEHDFLLFLLVPSRKRLYLVRDRFGVQPVYFKRSGGTFRFSQRIADLRESESLSSAKIRKYLVDFRDTEPVADSGTFFDGIHTVPPGCYFSMEGNSTAECVAYWRPEPMPIDRMTRKDLFGEFRERLFESVAYQTRDYQQVSAHLSGGMDSSLIALVYSKIVKREFPTFYLDISDKGHRDPYYARLVSSRISSRHIHVSPGRKDIYGSLTKLSRATSNPEAFILPSNVQYAIAEESMVEGSQAILTGMDGDSVVGHGWGYFEKLRRNDDWEVFIDEVFRFRMLRSDYLRKGAARVRKEIIERELFVLLKSRELKRFRNLMEISRQKFGYTPFWFIRYLARKACERMQGYRTPNDKEYFLNKDLRFERDEVYRATGLYEHDDREVVNNFRAAVNGEYPLHFEQFHAIGRPYGQYYLHPFFDRKLFELCLAVPDAVRYGEGKTRWLMRNAMKDLFPEELYHRQDKDDFSHYLVRSCCELWQNNREKFEENRELWSYVDKRRFLRHMNILLLGNHPVAVSRGPARKLNRILYLGAWLDALKSE